MKRKAVLVTIMVIMFCGILFCIPKSIKAEEQIFINETNFPDAIIRQRVSKVADTNKDGKLSVDERLSLKKIWFANEEDYLYMEDAAFISVGVKDITGINLFPNLEEVEIWCEKNSNLN